MITGELIRLRAIEEDDLPRFVTWLNDPEVLRNLLIYTPMSFAQEKSWYAEMLKQHVDVQPLCIDVKTSNEWEHAGNISFANLNTHDHSAEVGIFIGRKDLWGKGYGTEAMRLMVDYGFRQLNLNRIYLHVFETNPAGIRSYEKAGFSLEGRLREARFTDGHYIDILVMSILKSEWQKAKGDGE